MCLLCVDTDDLLEEKIPMSEPWESLKDELVGILRDGVKDFASETKPELQAFLVEKAKDAARWKWESLHADTPEKKLEAETNLRHIAAQVGGEAARLELAATERGKELLKKVLDVGLSALLKLGPKLLGL